ncbi:MAG: hypothetical protein WC716_15895 [Chitinophagaceae bacterium]|jgi:hypothetical protein
MPPHISYDGSNGQNTLTNKPLATPEESDYHDVSVDVGGINSYSVTAPDGKTLTLSKAGKVIKQVSSMIHGIAHNIGMAHGKGGVMENQHATIVPSQSYIDPKVILYDLVPKGNHVTKDNTQQLTNKIDDMTTQGRDYYKNKTDPDGSGRSMRGDGITKFKK